VTEQKYFRKGFKMRDDVQHLLDRDYRSEVVESVRENGNVLEIEGLTLRLADEFGFCYGVDRAVDYAFQTREKFPQRRIYITGDMIHNASMNDRLREMGIEFLSQGFDDRPDPPARIRRSRGLGAEAQREGVHRRGHDLRVGPLGVEARHALRPAGLHEHHPRQVLS
jgi:hypothetical protein